MPEFRWNIYQANLDPVVGSEQGKARPVLVISEEAINRLLSVLNVIPLTSMKVGIITNKYRELFGPRISRISTNI